MRKKKLTPLDPAKIIPDVRPEYIENKVPNARGLTPRQELFCMEYMRDLCAKDAYIRAGYMQRGDRAAAGGDKLMESPFVKDRIAELKAERAARLAITGDRVLGMLVDAYDKAMNSNDFSPAVRAAQLLGQHINLFKDHNSTTVRLAGITNSNSQEELDSDIARLIPIALYKPGLKNNLGDDDESDSPEK